MVDKSHAKLDDKPDQQEPNLSVNTLYYMCYYCV